MLQETKPAIHLIAAPIPKNEAARLAALRRYQILDTAPEQAFDDFALVASQICGTTVAMVSLVDRDRQWFKARVGISESESPRDQSFCGHTILGRDLLVVEDATTDERFFDNPLVTSDPHVRFYAGAPLVSAEGLAIGSLCAIDRKPRKLEPAQKQALEALARQVVAQMEYRLTARELAAALRDLRTLHGLLPICAYCKGIRDDAGYWQSIEEYLAEHSEVDFSHGYCPNCIRRHLPEVYAEMKATGVL